MIIWEIVVFPLVRPHLCKILWGLKDKKKIFQIRMGGLHSKRFTTSFIGEYHEQYKRSYLKAGKCSSLRLQDCWSVIYIYTYIYILWMQIHHVDLERCFIPQKMNHKNMAPVFFGSLTWPPFNLHRWAFSGGSLRLETSKG